MISITAPILTGVIQQNISTIPIDYIEVVHKDYISYDDRMVPSSVRVHFLECVNTNPFRIF